MPYHDSIRRALLLLFLFGVHALTAIADESDALNFSFTHNSTHDDNLFRLPESTSPAGAGGGSRSDTLNSTGIAAVFDWTYGIQRLSANVGATALRHRHNTNLDSDNFSGNLAWLWRTGTRLDGELSVSHADVQSSFADLLLPVNNTETTRNAVAAGNYWVHSEWSTGLRGAFTELSNSSPTQSTNDSDSSSIELNLFYRPASGNTIKLRHSQRSVRYTNQPASVFGRIDNDYRQRENGIDVNYQATGASALSISLNRVDRTYQQIAVRDFRGRTGRAGWNWQATGKTSIALSAQRAIDEEGQAVLLLTVTDTYSAAVNWAAGAKTSFSATWSDIRRKLSDSEADTLTGVATPNDQTRLLGLVATYLPIPRLSLTINLRDENRQSSLPIREYRSQQVIGGIAYRF